MNIMLAHSKRLMPTYIIIGLNVIVYAYTSIVGGNSIVTNEDLLLQYGQVNLLVMNGWYWQLFSSMFVHVNIIHLLGNMFFLLIFGLRAEEMFSTPEYLLIYFLSGLAGNLLTLFLGFYSVYWQLMVSAGASGAIFGVFGASIIYMRRTLGQSIITALLYSFFLLMLSAGPNVNNLAHLGGLVAGLLIGYVIATKRRLRRTYGFSYSYSTQM